MKAAADIGLGLDRVLAATGGTLARAGTERFAAVVIDGRELPRGALFFAVKGERFDGHDFVAQAVAGGGGGAGAGRGGAGPAAAPPRGGLGGLAGGGPRGARRHAGG